MKEQNKAYAGALFTLALENSAVESFSRDLHELLALVTENPAYKEFLSSVALPLSARLDAIDEAFAGRTNEHIVSFLKLLCEKGHIASLDECIREFFVLEEALAQSVTVTVYSGAHLSDEQKERLCHALETKYKKSVTALYRVDEALIGGIKIVTEDTVWDGSLVSDLQSLKEVMKS